MRQRSLSHLCDRVEREVLHMDPGDRGLAAFRRVGELWKAFAALSSPDCRVVGIMTGFPCLQPSHGAQFAENDGPLGAIALARALAQIGKRPVLLTDRESDACMRVCNPCDGDGAYPVVDQVCVDDDKRVDLVASLSLSHVVAIERAGPASDGAFRTMSARDISSLCSPRIHQIFSDPRVRSIGIGDGGNELGMGNVSEAVTRHVTHGKIIACHVPSTEACITVGVSNWGGWALAILLLSTSNLSLVQVNKALPSVTEQSALLDTLFMAGVRDGVTGKQGCVDGAPFFDVHAKVLSALTARLHSERDLL